MRIFHNLFEHLTFPRLWKGLACVFSSLALTAYADLFALNTVWTRLLVFIWIFAACLAFTYGAGRLFKSAPPPKMVLQAAAASALALALLQGVLFPHTAQEVLITLVSKTAGEICLCDLVIDGINCPLAEADVVDNSGWLYREQYDNFMIWPEEDGAENHLTMRFFAEEVRVGFPYTPYAGSVAIQSSAGGGETLDLRCPEWEAGEEVQYADIPIDCRRTYAPLERICCNAGLFLVLTSVFLILRYAAGLAWGKMIGIAPGAVGPLKPAASRRGPKPRAFSRGSVRKRRPPRPKRDYSALPLWLAVALAAVLFAALYRQYVQSGGRSGAGGLPPYFMSGGERDWSPPDGAPMREDKTVCRLGAKLCGGCPGVLPAVEEGGNTLFPCALRTAGSLEGGPCRVYGLPESALE